MSNQRVVLVTGASSGVGQATARVLSRQNYQVFGTSRRPSAAEAVPGVEMVELDVGAMRMVRTVLPFMRNRRQGQIVNVSSVSGLTPIPFMGLYSASKFALEGFTEALRYEVRLFNVRVSRVEPAFLNTPMMRHRTTAVNLIDDYDQ